jgi:hypothetical protein
MSGTSRSLLREIAQTTSPCGISHDQFVRAITKYVELLYDDDDDLQTPGLHPGEVDVSTANVIDLTEELLASI